MNSKRIGIAGFIHETNTFSLMETTLDSFVNQGGFYPKMLRGNELFTFKEQKMNIATSGFLSTSDKFGFEIIPLTWCGAEPSAQLPKKVFNHIMGLIEDDISNNLPLDGLYLDLHGAMVYEDHNDAETEILRRVRKIVGDDIPIIASLDLHGNITKECFELSSALVGYRTYPHIDGYETGQRSAQIMQHLLLSKPLYKAFKKIPFLMPSTTQPTTIEPCKSLYKMLPELEENPAIISATIMEGFPPVDIADTGPSVFAYATTQDLADYAVSQLYDTILENEDKFQCNLLTPDEAVQKAIKLSKTTDKPIILADIQDNVGGGSSSDTVWLLEALVRHNAKKAALGLIFDPDIATIAHEVGVGHTIEVDLGGKLLPGHKPFHGTFTIENLYEGEFLGTGPMVKDRTLNLGKMAHLMIDNIHVVICSDRMQALDQSFFKIVGIEPKEMKILVLKSANHYRADFGPISSTIINVDAPGAIIEDPVNIPYKNLREGVRLKGLGPEFKRQS